jgi:Ion channel
MNGMGAQTGNKPKVAAPEKSAVPGRIRAWQPGSRLERIRASHSYGFVLSLVLVSIAFTSMAPARTWSSCVMVLIDTAILGIALWTSGLHQRRIAIPVIAVIGCGTALVAANGGSTTRGGAGLVEATFLFASCTVIGAGVFDQREINRQSVLGALSVYLTVGMLFSIIYGAVADLGAGPLFAQGTDGDPAIRVYFSFVTLATLGYGDYTPASDLSRMLAVVEALSGQLYLVTVVALLVANLGHTRRERP